MKQLTLEDIIPGGKNYHTFLPDLPLQIEVYSHFFILCYNARIECRERGNSLRWDLSLTTILDILKIKMNEIPVLTFSKDERAVFIQNNVVYQIALSGGEISVWGKIPSYANNITFHPNLEWVAYTYQSQIWVKNREKEPILLYEESDENITIGKIPSRDEFGISKTLFWSPDAQKLAFYRIDETNVTSYPIVHIQEPIAEVEMIKYPMAGQKSELVTIGVASLSGHRTIVIDTQTEMNDDFNHFESYKACLTWSPDSDSLFFAELQRNQQKYQLKSYDASTGKFKKLLYTEEDARYVEPQYELYFFGNHQIIFQSRRDNFNHLYQLDTQTCEVRQITKGEWEVTKLIGSKGDEIIFQATLPTPIDRSVFAVNLTAPTQIRTIYSERGTTNLFIHLQANYSIALHSSRINPGQLILFTENETSHQEIYQLEDPYHHYNFPQQEVGTLNIDGDEVYYRITYPEHYAEKENWPLVFYLYGGPHVQLIRNEWGSGTKGFEEMMALNDCVTFCIDPHGSDNRGKQFESVIWRNIGEMQTKDYLKALDWLLDREKRISVDNIALYGWSFGGFMTMRLLLSQPQRFRKAVAGGAVIDWRYYEVMYTERYMQTPQENPKGYIENSIPELLSEHLKDNQLCLIHCDNDPVVLWQHTLTLVKYCNQKGIDVDYYVFPGHKHNVVGSERVHLMRVVANRILAAIQIT